ncbi:ornithine cyclodeaminase [Salmonella bongori]|uniref:ornithine cyclodeaminase n=1 Tax=Salmonella bongori TaxID=54736 RepID=UPI000499ED26|nr:ornithine cyclodeaminase [Salmonella bongori]AID27385.1 ornithine cyclodeaminase [Salmonella bongori serovar 48:z41:-- str. RKS3044]
MKKFTGQQQEKILALVCGDVEILPPLVVGKLVRAALRALRRQESYGVKAVLEPDQDELQLLLGKKNAPYYPPGERANWKLSALLSINASYGAVKIVGSHSYNHHLGLPRSTSTILLYDKLSMRPVSIMDGTTLSAQRTGAYASIVIDRLMQHCETFSVFIFGAGCVANAIIEDLLAHHAGRINTIYVRSRTQKGAETLAAHFVDRITFPIIAVENLDHLSDCMLVITASNAEAPLFDASQINSASVILHLGGNEIPGEWVRYILEKGTVICDDIASVSHRGSQSLAIFFQQTGHSLKSMAEVYQIKNLWQILDESTAYPLPALVTCVGLPVLDLYLAQYIYETTPSISSKPVPSNGDFLSCK